MKNFVMLMVFCGIAGAGETKPASAEPAARPDPAALAQLLGSEDYAAREAASQKLRDLGFAAIPALRDAAERAADLEVQSRALMIAREVLMKPAWVTTLREFAEFKRPFDKDHSEEVLASLKMISKVTQEDVKLWQAEDLAKKLEGSKLSGKLLDAIEADDKTLAATTKRVEGGSAVSDFGVQIRVSECLDLIHSIRTDLRKLHGNIKPKERNALPAVEESIFRQKMGPVIEIGGGVLKIETEDGELETEEVQPPAAEKKEKK